MFQLEEIFTISRSVYDSKFGPYKLKNTANLFLRDPRQFRKILCNLGSSYAIQGAPMQFRELLCNSTSSSAIQGGSMQLEEFQ